MALMKIMKKEQCQELANLGSPTEPTVFFYYLFEN